MLIDHGGVSSHPYLKGNPKNKIKNIVCLDSFFLFPLPSPSFMFPSFQPIFQFQKNSLQLFVFLKNEAILSIIEYKLLHIAKYYLFGVSSKNSKEKLFIFLGKQKFKLLSSRLISLFLFLGRKMLGLSSFSTSCFENRSLHSFLQSKSKYPEDKSFFIIYLRTSVKSTSIFERSLRQNMLLKIGYIYLLYN